KSVESLLKGSRCRSKLVELNFSSNFYNNNSFEDDTVVDLSEIESEESELDKSRDSDYDDLYNLEDHELLGLDVELNDSWILL
ncbi:35465_t:CDS:2, partial [Racocetra persica]